MVKRTVVVLAAAALAACQTMGGLTVKDYTAKSGQRVMAGQAEPKSEYSCAKVAQARHDWGMKGTMNTVGAMERVTTEAVDAAPGKGANYAYVKAPAQVGVGAVNVNAFSDAQVAYYKCNNLPAGK
jgi:uncharacterized protein YpuA (DUF1002 family)